MREHLLRSAPVLLLLCALGCSAASSTDESPISGSVAADPLPGDDELKEMLDEVLTFTYNERHLNLEDHGAWQILHGALPYGTRFNVYNGEVPVPAIQWVLDGKQMKGWTLRRGTKNLQGGRRGLKLLLESGTKIGQGHEDQWLAVMAQSGLPIDTEIKFQGETYLLQDVVQQALWEVHEGKECSWTLIAMVRYLADIDAEWDAADGNVWTIEKLVEMEANQNLDDSACGGTHRLIGMTMALDEFRRQGGAEGPLSGGWAKAERKIAAAIAKAREYQHQGDGLFSTNYFTRPGTQPELSTQIETTGHTLEFLALALDKQQLSEPWVVKAVVKLCELFHLTRNVQLECGSLYHATHGLMEYRERRFGPFAYPRRESDEAGEADSDVTLASGAASE